MDDTNIALVRRLYGAYLEGDVGTVMAAFAPEVRWHNSGYDPTAGTLEGIDAVMGYLAAQDHMDDFSLEVIDILASADRAAVIARSSGRRGNRRLDNDFVQLIRVEEGRVVEVWNYMWDQRALAEFMAIAM